MSALGDCLKAVAAVFAANELDWYVFGAQAVVVRGSPRATQDVDITVALHGLAAEDLEQALVAAGFRHRYPDLAEELLRDGSVFTLFGPGGMDVDVVLAGSGLEALAMTRATPAFIDGVEVPVASATDLVVMKVLAGRGKDLDDVRALLGGGEVDLIEARDVLEQFEQALGQSDLVRALDDAAADQG